MSNELPGYDAWKTHNPADDYLGDEYDEDCTCRPGRRNEWCPIHGRDPDYEYDTWRDRQDLLDDHQ